MHNQKSAPQNNIEDHKMDNYVDAQNPGSNSNHLITNTAPYNGNQIDQTNCSQLNNNNSYSQQSHVNTQISPNSTAKLIEMLLQQMRGQAPKPSEDKNMMLQNCLKLISHSFNNIQREQVSTINQSLETLKLAEISLTQVQQVWHLPSFNNPNFIQPSIFHMTHRRDFLKIHMPQASNLMKMDLDYQKDHRNYSQIDPLFFKSLQRQANIVENCEVKQKPFFMENKLCLEKSQEIQSIIFQKLLTPQLLKNHFDIQIVRDNQLPDRLVKVLIPNCASILLELNVNIQEQEQEDYRLLINDISIDYKPAFSITTTDKLWAQSKCQNLSRKRDKSKKDEIDRVNMAILHKQFDLDFLFEEVYKYIFEHFLEDLLNNLNKKYEHQQNRFNINSERFNIDKEKLIMVDIYYGGNGLFNNDIERGSKILNCFIYLDIDQQCITIQNQSFLQAQSKGGIQSVTENTLNLTKKQYKINELHNLSIENVFDGILSDLYQQHAQYIHDQILFHQMLQEKPLEIDLQVDKNCLLIKLSDLGLQINFKVSNFGMVELEFKNQSGAHFGNKTVKVLQKFINSDPLVFEIINDDFSSEENQAGIPLFDLLFVNCIMSYLEQNILSYGTMFKEFCFTRKYMIKRRVFEIPDEQQYGLRITTNQKQMDADQHKQDIENNQDLIEPDVQGIKQINVSEKNLESLDKLGILKKLSISQEIYTSTDDNFFIIHSAQLYFTQNQRQQTHWHRYQNFVLRLKSVFDKRDGSEHVTIEQLVRRTSNTRETIHYHNPEGTLYSRQNFTYLNFWRKWSDVSVSRLARFIENPITPSQQSFEDINHIDLILSEKPQDPIQKVALEVLAALLLTRHKDEVESTMSNQIFEPGYQENMS